MLLHLRNYLCKTRSAKLMSLCPDCVLYVLQCEELALATLEDMSVNVVVSVTQILIPVLAKWAFDLGRLQSHLLTHLLQKLKSQIKVIV